MERRRRGGDHGVVGQTVHVGRFRGLRDLRGLALSAALSLVVGGFLTGCTSSGASARTTLIEARNARLVTASGHSEAAVPDTSLPTGSILRTAANGSAILNTGGRVLYLGGPAEYVVGSGVTGELRSGAAVVDTRHGPTLSLRAGQVTVRSGHSAIRVERGFSVRVGVFSGSADVTTVPGGNATTVDALHQVVVAGRGLPGETPLVLTDDDAEQRVALALVEDDQRLRRSASVLDRARAGRALVRLAGAAGLELPVSAAELRRGAGPHPPVSELALPLAIARAAVGSHATVSDLDKQYSNVRDLRAAGGSWGVVAHLAGTDADETDAAINLLLSRVPGIGTVAVPGNGSSSPSTPNGTGRPSTSPEPNGNPTGGPGPSPNPTASGGSPHPSPTPSGSFVDDLVGAVSGLVGPTPTPTSRSGSGAHQPAPQPTCLLLGLVCQ